MKILILTNNIKNAEAVKWGLDLAKQRASTVGYNFEYIFKDSKKVFTGTNFNNSTVGNGSAVDPNQILEEIDGQYKIACLIYDWDKVSPKPTNPVQSPILKNGCNPIQIPENWYNQDPEILCQYFLHEVCHSGYFFANNVAGDKTHAYTDEFNQKQRWEYYIHLLSQLKPFLETQHASPISAYPTLKQGSTGEHVKQLQRDLKTLGYFKYPLITGRYGSITKSAVQAFQYVQAIHKTPRIVVDGIAGPITLNAIKSALELKKKSSTLIDVLIKIESNGDDYAIGDLKLKHKAYGCLQIRQPVCDDVNKKFGTNRVSIEMLGNRALSIDTFNKYMECYPKNVTNEEKARAWNGGGNWKLVYNKKGWETYSKNLDAYWKKVEALLK